MNGKTVLITGANSGIGFETALSLACSGADVVMACRDTHKANNARREILQRVPGARVVTLHLDISDLNSVREFASRFSERVGVLDILINNAGVVAMPLRRTELGHELHLATNYLGPFSLTGRLLPCLRQGAPTRVVNVGSLAHRLGNLDPDDLNWRKTPYDKWKAYANSKMAMMSHTLELNRRLQRHGHQTIALAAHPGFANTSVQTKSPALAPKNAAHKWLKGRLAHWVPAAAEAARPIIEAATGDVTGGDHYGPAGMFEIKGRPAKARVNPLARDSTLAARLWRVSQAMTEVEYPFGP